MPKTLDSIARNQKAATERRLAGKPIWDRKVVVDRIDGAPFETNRDLFASALERSTWLTDAGEDSELWHLWDEIEDSEDVEHFDAVLEAIYDLADDERVWLTVNYILAPTESE